MYNFKKKRESIAFLSLFGTYLEIMFELILNIFYRG